MSKLRGSIFVRQRRIAEDAKTASAAPIEAVMHDL
jgi:hypothetical protein